jgi:hypothetical protein
MIMYLQSGRYSFGSFLFFLRINPPERRIPDRYFNHCISLAMSCRPDYRIYAPYTLWSRGFQLQQALTHFWRFQLHFLLSSVQGVFMLNNCTVSLFDRSTAPPGGGGGGGGTEWTECPPLPDWHSIAHAPAYFIMNWRRFFGRNCRALSRYITGDSTKVVLFNNYDLSEHSWPFFIQENSLARSYTQTHYFSILCPKPSLQSGEHSADNCPSTTEYHPNRPIRTPACLGITEALYEGIINKSSRIWQRHRQWFGNSAFLFPIRFHNTRQSCKSDKWRKGRINGAMRRLICQCWYKRCIDCYRRSGPIIGLGPVDTRRCINQGPTIKL